MKATFLGCDFNVERSGYKGANMTYQPDPYKGQAKEPVTRFVIGKSPIIEELKGVKAGDRVEIKFDDTKWKNPVSITAIHEEAPASRVTGNTGNSAKFGNQDPDTQVRIARSVAIKEASNLVCTMIAHGGFPATAVKKSDVLVSEILRIAEAFEPYLCLQDKGKPQDTQVPDIDDESPFGDNEFNG